MSSLTQEEKQNIVSPFLFRLYLNHYFPNLVPLIKIYATKNYINFRSLSFNVIFRK